MKTRFAATLLCVALAGSACGGSGRDLPTPESPMTAAGRLRVTMETLFREQAFLLGIVMEDAVTAQFKGVEGGTQALEESTLEIGNLFSEAYGDSGQKGFLTSWRPLSGLVVGYLNARMRKLKIDRFDTALKNAGLGFASFAGKLTPLLNRNVMSRYVAEYVEELKTAAAALVAKDFAKGAAYVRLAGDKGAILGRAFARALGDDIPALYPGDPLSPAASFRAALGGTLIEYVYLNAMTTENILTKQIPSRDGAKKALDASIVSLSKLLTPAYGSAAEKAFVPLWQRQSELFIAYAGAGRDQQRLEATRQGLERFATEAAAFFVGLNERLDRTALEQIIGAHGHAMTQTIDSQFASDFSQAGIRLRAAARQIEAFGSALATATVIRYPVRFQSTPAGFRT